MSIVRKSLESGISRRRVVQAGAATAAVTALGLPRLAGAQEASPAADAPVYNGEEVTVTYGFWDTAQEAAIDAQIEAFKAVQPNITIEKQIVPWADYWTQLQTAVAGGQTFDVFWINTANVPVYGSVGALYPITSIVDVEGGIDTSLLPTSLVEEYAFDGVQYGVPRDFDTIALYYNKDIFDAAGVEYPGDDISWEDFRALAEQMNNPEGGIWGAGMQTSGQENYSNYVFQNGAQYLNEDLTECIVDSPEGTEAFEYLANFFVDGLTPDIAIQQANPVADSLFPAGNVAMMTGGSFRAGTYSALDANIDVVPLPYSKERATVIHGLANVIWANTQQPAAALEWVKFLHSDEGETILGESGATIPAMAGKQEAYIAANEGMNVQVFIDAADYGVATQNPTVGPAWQSAVAETVVEGFAGNIAPDQIATEAAAAANAALQQG
jgi:multiple sugar transport system substrate-binding protein